MKQKIAIKFCNGFVLPQEATRPDNIGYSLSFISEMMAYGYMPNEQLIDVLANLPKDDITTLYNEVLPILKESVGAHVTHKPFYPNFPEQVMNASDAKLYFNALAHYFTKGKWKPNFTVAARPVSFENVKFKSLGVVTEDDIDNVFTQILESADSISESSKKVLAWFITSGRPTAMPESIPFKENVCLIAGLLIDNDMWNSDLVKDTTDILRIVTVLNDGDVSLAKNTKFKSLPRKLRKAFCADLDRVANEEDFLRHKNKWVKLFHNLHVGDYSKRLFEMAKKLRENIKIETFNSKFEEALQNKDISKALKLAKTRPGIFARNIGRMLTGAPLGLSQEIIRTFAEIVDDIPVRNLTQLWGSMKTRKEDVLKRVVFPKGSVAKAYVLRNKLARLSEMNVGGVISTITDSLDRRFKAGESLGNVFIDPAMYECPLPTAMRSASEGLKEVARGTRMPIGDKDSLRFFVYWTGQDIDLSATFHDADFNTVSQVSYTHPRDTTLKAYHSGDITSAPNGASEFIDVDIATALASNMKVRYVAMNVLSYSGQPFNEIEECFVGWMTRDNVKSNEIYEPKTVEQKIDLNMASKNTVTVVFDLLERKAIWTDVTLPGRSENWGSGAVNNVENSRASIQDTVEAITSLNNKITLGELFEIHAIARGKIVEDRAEADTVFAMDEGVTPYDVTTINAEYL